ncbi:MAG: APC family permease [Pseudorhodoplanes sp.]
MALKPVLGPVQLTFYSVGVIVGAGVYSVIGAAAGLAGDGLWLSFLIGAIVAALTGLSYAEMTTTFPHAGAEYVYLRHALPERRFAAFGVGILILVGGGATAATVATAFGGYLQQFLDVPIVLSAMLLLVFCTAINIWGLRESSWANMVFTTVEVGGLLLVIAAGFKADMIAPLAAPPHLGVIPAAAVLFFVYLGFEEIANMTEEVRNPARDLPLAIFLSIAVTTLLYILVSLAAVGLVPSEQLAASQAPLTLAVQKAWPNAAPMLSAIALFATANTVLITLIATSRLAFSMGRDHELPAVFARVLHRRGTPWIGAVLILAIACLLVPIGDLRILAEISSLTALLAFLCVNLALILLRYAEPDRLRPFRVPLAIGRLPILPVAAIASIFVLLSQFEGRVYIAGGGLLALIWVGYALRQHARHRR